MQNQKIVDELRSLQPIIEEITGLKARGNGLVNVMDDATMELLTGRVVFAEKEWNRTE